MATALPAATSLKVHSVDPYSRANGPGVRFVVWLQGCTLGCPGCFNPATHDATKGQDVAVEELTRQMHDAGSEGLSLSGGEPLQQAAGATALLAAARRFGMSTLAFSGYSLDEIYDLPGGTDVLARLDVLIDGRYVAAERLAKGLRGSHNQQIHLLTSRYSLADVEATPVAEVVISRNGDLVLTGVDPIKLKR